MVLEIETAEELRTHLREARGLRGVRLQDVDLRGDVGAELLRSPERLDGLVVLGGDVPADVARALTSRGAILFPVDPHLPVNTYRHTLYTAAELYRGMDSGGYAATPDAVAYAWFGDCRARDDAYATAMRALHDDSIRDALHEVLADRATVGIMGGHAMGRTSPAYRDIAHLARDLADDGLTVLTGGGPGAMEAANLGACDRTGALDDALDVIRRVESFRPSIEDWARVGFEAKARLVPHQLAPGDVRSVGIPTWFYGHEPPNVFGDVVAKYFSNALREDDLLAGAHDAVIVLEGAAGTVQEIFQCVTPLYYAAEGTPLPDVVLVGRRQWSETVPVWPALRALADGRDLANHLHLVQTPQEALAVVRDRRAPGRT